MMYDKTAGVAFSVQQPSATDVHRKSIPLNKRISLELEKRNKEANSLAKL
jgi:hypothetical protein